MIIRYFWDLGDNENVNVEWSDFNTKSSKFCLKDERHPFEEKLPHQALANIFVQIKTKDAKIITITLFYTTNRCLVQGNMCQEWIQKEFEQIRNTIDKSTKGSNRPKQFDKKIRKLPAPKMPNIDVE